MSCDMGRAIFKKCAIICRYQRAQRIRGDTLQLIHHAHKQNHLTAGVHDGEQEGTVHDHLERFGRVHHDGRASHPNNRHGCRLRSFFADFPQTLFCRTAEM